MSSTQFGLKRDGLYPTYFETLSIPGAAHLSTWVAVGTFSVVILTILYLKYRLLVLIGTFALLAACVALVPVTMRGIHAMLLSWVPHVPTFLREDVFPPADFPKWFDAEFEKFSKSRFVWTFGVAYSAFAVAAFWQGGAFQALSMFVAGLCLFVAVLASFVCGVGLASIGFLCRFIWHLGRRYGVRISDHGYGVLSTGRFLVKCYLLVALVWCVYAASATWTLPAKWVPMAALAAPSVLFFISSFVICQFPLHKRMVESKRASLRAFDDLLERLMPKDPLDMTEERRQQIDFCAAEMRRVRKLSEWPFSLGNLSGVLGASFGAIAPQLLKVALQDLSRFPWPWNPGANSSMWWMWPLTLFPLLAKCVVHDQCHHSRVRAHQRIAGSPGLQYRCDGCADPYRIGRSRERAYIPRWRRLPPTPND